MTFGVCLGSRFSGRSQYARGRLWKLVPNEFQEQQKQQRPPSSWLPSCYIYVSLEKDGRNAICCCLFCLRQKRTSSKRAFKIISCNQQQQMPKEMQKCSRWRPRNQLNTIFTKWLINVIHSLFYWPHLNFFSLFYLLFLFVCVGGYLVSNLRDRRPWHQLHWSKLLKF